MRVPTRKYLVYPSFCYVVTFHCDRPLLQPMPQKMRILIESGTRGKSCEPIALEGTGTFDGFKSMVKDSLRRNHPDDTPRWEHFVRLHEDGQVDGWTYPLEVMATLIRECSPSLDLASAQLEHEPEILALFGGLDNAQQGLEYCAKMLHSGN